MRQVVRAGPERGAENEIERNETQQCQDPHGRTADAPGDSPTHYLAILLRVTPTSTRDAEIRANPAMRARRRRTPAAAAPPMSWPPELVPNILLNRKISSTEVELAGPPP